MLRCKTERILDPIKAVTDHLSERIILESNEETYLNGTYVKTAPSLVRTIVRKQEAFAADSTAMNVNNNLMFRSMFFMNDEPRHFLAPHLPAVLSNSESEYFQKKPHQTVVNNLTSTGLTTNTASTQVSTTTTTENITQTVKPAALKQRPHSCDECGKTFLLKHHLATHFRVHTGERPYVCPECGKTFALKHCLSTHLLLHSAERPYKCNECNKSFTLKHHLVSHEKMHTRDRPFECRECGQTFAQKRHLSTHLKYHSGERPYSCQVCGETFTREEHLVMHSRFHGGLQPYICSDCGAGFLRKFQLVEHERQHGRCPDACPTCGKEFLQKRTLLLHVRTCGLTPNPHSHISSHAEHSSQLSKVCKDCGEAFSSAEGLALHMRLHVGDHSFLSDICSLAASLKQAAGTQTPHMNFQKKTHSCPDCNRTFTQKHGLNQHLIRYPNGACKLKPFRCEKCGKSFSQKNHLVLHERQHMEPSERSELKHRNHHQHTATSTENSQAAASLMRQLELSSGSARPGSLSQISLQQKTHIILHERQMDAAERNELNKHRSMADSQLMGQLDLADQEQQLALIKSDGGERLDLSKQNMDMRHLDMSEDLNKRHVMHDGDDKHMDTGQNLLKHLQMVDSSSKYGIERDDDIRHLSLPEDKHQHSINKNHVMHDERKHSSDRNDLNKHQNQLMRQFDLAEQQQLLMKGGDNGDRHELGKQTMDLRHLEMSEDQSLALSKRHIHETDDKHMDTGQSLLKHLEMVDDPKYSLQRENMKPTNQSMLRHLDMPDHVADRSKHSIHDDGDKHMDTGQTLLKHLDMVDNKYTEMKVDNQSNLLRHMEMSDGKHQHPSMADKHSNLDVSQASLMRHMSSIKPVHQQKRLDSPPSSTTVSSNDLGKQGMDQSVALLRHLDHPMTHNPQ